MQIPAYQIHNVLKTYSRQVSQNKLSMKTQGMGGHNTSMDKISISAEGKKQGVIDKVASDIVKKITTDGPTEAFEKKIVDRIENEFGKKFAFSESKDFKYYEIDASSKTMNTFSLEDSKAVQQRMEDLTKDILKSEMNNNKGEDQ